MRRGVPARGYGPTRTRSRKSRLQVEVLESRELLSLYTVTTTADSGPGSLRQAILDADFQPGPNSIAFHIGSGGPQTIAPLTDLPQILAPMTIDGTTQPGFAGTPLIEIRGDSANSGANGLLISGGGTTVKGLTINRFGGSAIRIQIQGGNVIEGNYLGTDASGLNSLGNNVDGVLIIGSSANRIGGTTADARNIIAGNHAVGVRVVGPNAFGNVIEGNGIGTNVLGTAALGNTFDGVLLDGASNTTVGGLTPGTGNVISGNGAVGVRIMGAGAVGNVVQGNAIGTQADGSSPLGNASSGVYITSSATNNVIGGMSAGAGNRIAFNSGAGVAAVSAVGNAILSNNIFNNVYLGIVIGSGGLNQTNLPTLISAFRQGPSTIVQGTIKSTPNTTLVLQIFFGPTGGPSGYGNNGGQTLLTTSAVVTDGNGNGSFKFTLPLTIPSRQWVTATATDPSHTTYEFSQGVFSLSKTAGDYDGDGKGDLALFNAKTAVWSVLQSQAGPVTNQFGMPGGTTPVPQDWDVDGRTDLAVFQPPIGQWFVFGSRVGPYGFQFGTKGDIPVSADYDGDGKVDAAVYRPSTGQWFVQGSRIGSFVTQFGGPNDVPVPGDYEGRGQVDLAVYRPATSQWFLLTSTGPKVLQFGAPGGTDVPVPADYDGDGITDLAVYRPGAGTWFINRSQAGPQAVAFGAPNLDLAVPADYDGDGKGDLAVYRPTTATWYILQTTAGPRAQQYGAPNQDLPANLPMAYRVLNGLLPFTAMTSSTSAASASSSSSNSFTTMGVHKAADPGALVVLPDTPTVLLPTLHPTLGRSRHRLQLHDAAMRSLASPIGNV